MSSMIPPRAAFAAALLLAAPAAHAQEADNPFPFLNQTPTAPAADADPADALARNLRVLGDDPNNLGALMGAGRAALEVGDPSSSIGFWARADKVAPNNGQVKAGLAAALVQAERPRLALPLFARATALGVPEADIAADRGLAYDLTGDNRQAQRDYRIALQRHPDPETTRRLALSLAMSGDRAGAIAQLDPLLRKQDMGAWRARAFVLALTGDPAGAVADAHALLPKPQADSISPFLTRLASLNREQQASAVHFGEMPATGRAATTLALASNTPPSSAPVAAGARPGASTASLNRAQARATSPGAQIAAAQPAPARPSPGPVSASVDFAGRAPGQAVTSAPAVARATPPAATYPPAIAWTPAPAYAQATPPATQPATTRAAPPPAAPQITAPRSTAPAYAQATPPVLRPAPSVGTSEIAPAPSTSEALPARAIPSTPRVAAPPAAVAPPTRYAANTLGAETLALGSRLPSVHTTIPVAPSTRPSTTGDVDELAHSQATHGTPHASAKQVLADDDVPSRGATKGRTKTPAAADTDDDKPATKRGSKTNATASAADAKTAKAAKAKAAADAKADRDAKAAAKASPSRVWVQVAGGANKHDLGKEWTKLNKQAGALYAGRTPQTVPYRHTNRLMVGPFKSEDEAQDYVNKLVKGGQSGFIVKTGGGEKVEKVDTN